MKTTEIHGIILAAGEGKRLQSNTAKVLHPLAGKAMVEYVIDAMDFMGSKPLAVVGHKAEQIREALGERVSYSEQREQLGTGHALLCARDSIQNWQGYVLVLAGDMPLLKKESLMALYEGVASAGASAGMLTARKKDATGYGRVLRTNAGRVAKIVEERDATPEEKAIDEVNISAYCFALPALLRALDRLRNDNAQGEYYLTDCIQTISEEDGGVLAIEVEEEQGLGVNDMIQMAAAERSLRQRINEKHMALGVRILDPANCYIDSGVEIGREVTIYPGNVIVGKTTIGAGSKLLPGNYIEDSNVGEANSIGPNAHLRPKTVTGRGCRVGNFVELKNVTLADGAKVSHLAYCGDGSIGARSNISCGAIFSNYDGVNKGFTEVGDDVFVGCNANLVAPIRLGDNAYVAAGSTLTGDVPAEALAIGRARQVNKEGWAREKSPKALAKKKEERRK